MFSTRKLATAAIGLLLVGVTGCSGGGAPNDDADGGNAGGDGGGTSCGGGSEYTIAMVTHEQPGTAFWDRVRTGARVAAEKHCIDLRYSNDPEASKQATLIQNAIDSNVDGLAVTLSAPDAVGPAAAQAVEAAIPTVALNAGIDTYQDYGVMMYFGSAERLAGESAGARAAEDGDGKVLCVVHAEGNVSLEDRCAGVKESFPNTENIQVNGADLASATSSLQAKLAQDTDITYIATLDAGVATAALSAKDAAGSEAKIFTFDLNPEVVQAIQDGQIEFSIDQQPYLQGYLAVDSLWLQLTNGNDIGGGQPVLTGPSFVDASNIDRIAEFAANNTR